MGYFVYQRKNSVLFPPSTEGRHRSGYVYLYFGQLLHNTLSSVIKQKTMHLPENYREANIFM